MTERYEIQCPGCSRALVIPASNMDELQAYWRWREANDLAFQCPGCWRVFRGLLERMDHSEDCWDVIVDINGSRFNAARKRLDELFLLAREPQYL